MQTTLAPAPLRGSGSRAGRLRGPLVAAGGVALAALALHLHDPHRSGSWGYCPLYALTGLYCPGCGGLRAVNDLTNGELRAALSSNLVAVGLMSLVLVGWMVTIRDRWVGRAGPRLTGRTRAVVTLTGVAVALAFTVVRNTSWGAALAPGGAA